MVLVYINFLKIKKFGKFNHILYIAADYTVDLDYKKNN